MHSRGAISATLKGGKQQTTINRMISNLKDPDTVSISSRRSVGRRGKGRGRGRGRSRANSVVSVTSTRRLSATSLASAYAEGDFEDEIETGDGKRNKDRRKAYLIFIFVTHCVVSFAFIIGNVAVWIMVLSTQMKYFVREASFFSVVCESSSVIIDFLIGSLLHFLASLYSVICVKGWRKNDKFVLKYRDKLLLSMICVAVLGEYFICAASVAFFGNFPVVYNGAFEHAALPPRPKDPNCTSLLLLRPSTHKDNQQVRVNLKWMADVNCVIFEKLLDKAFDVKVKTYECSQEKFELVRLAKEDCRTTELLVNCHYSYIILDFLGLFFCGALLYLYVKAVVKARPVRFSLIPIPAEEIQERLQASERIKQFAIQQAAASTPNPNSNINIRNDSAPKTHGPIKVQFNSRGSSTPSITEKRASNQGATTKVGSKEALAATRTGSNPVVNK